MKTTAAVLWGLGEKWSVEEVDLDPPKEQEVLVRLTASGLCHSDAHLVTGDVPIPFPVVGQMCMLGTFSPLTVVPAASVVKIDDDLPLEVAALVGCGVTTGYGSAVYTAEVKAGDTVVVMGAGGIGMNAVQGARIAGAERIVVVDPVAFKREQSMAFGATHTAESVDEAWNVVSEQTRGRMADAARQGPQDLAVSGAHSPEKGHCRADQGMVDRGETASGAPRRLAAGDCRLG